MIKTRVTALIILLLGLLVGYFVYGSEAKIKAIRPIPTPAFFSNFPFKLGLDLSGGTHLVYKADVSVVKSTEVADSMEALRDVIERRVNLFGVAEPIVQTEESRLGGGEHRLIVDLPGVTDIDKAVAMIGQTPLLEFKIERPNGAEKEALVKKLEAAQKLQAEGKLVTEAIEDPYFISTNLTGRYLERAQLEFDQNTGEPKVGLQFDKEGSEFFAQITKENIGKSVAIYLDGLPISTPVVREEITGGQAQISGSFTPKEAKILVGRLNSGALPVPISLISTQTIGPSLGERAIEDGLTAGLYSLIVLAVFFLLWYRLPGVVAVFALAIYLSIMLGLFKLIPVTLTAAGIAGFIISLGIAVDANILIFERIKEEIRAGQKITAAIEVGFNRAWLSIRDANLTTLIAAIILFWFGTSSIQGFALVFGLGIIMSMFSAIIVSRYFLKSLAFGNGRVIKFLFSSGFSK